ncbi:aminopeptidase [uncultured Clostridium sp.]|uniref:aminopeptidase n=1 Tax=uncultured Clostridium sp. TaxID=59620 RepID=UPI0026132E88|nr:aminopeptidase [uncultured Clostridium sp.]
MIKDFNLMLEKYAELIVKKGLNIQKDGLLFINSPIECAEFSRMISEKAFKIGAKDVYINYGDENFSKIKFENASIETLQEVPSFEVEKYLYYQRKGASFLSISASNPELLKDIDSKKVSAASASRSIALKEYYEKVMNNENAWCVVSIPSKAWARKVFSTLSEDEAVDALWETIFKIVRVDLENPVDAWAKHSNSLKENIKFFEKYNFKTLKYKNSLGTDLEIELPKDHIWCGGSDVTSSGVEFIANIPTEEIFTLPLKTGVNGIVYSTKPLNHNGTLINEFSLTFKDGRIVDFTAKEGYDALKELIETDEGSHYLGEVALVPYDSPISNSNILFYNTLFDENASCHLAIGRAYGSCIKGGETMSDEELEANGVNDSLNHVDFMVGSKDLNIVGYTYDGVEVQVFKDGNFAF